MTNRWSKTAANQLRDILHTISDELSKEDAQRWRRKIREAVAPIRTFPGIGSVVPLASYLYPPVNYKHIRQVVCHPYRIIYETVGNANRILAVLHGRLMITPQDTRWS